MCVCVCTYLIHAFASMQFSVVVVAAAFAAVTSLDSRNVSQCNGGDFGTFFWIILDELIPRYVENKKPKIKL